MPKKQKKNLVEQYTVGDIEFLRSMSGMVLYGVLYGISDEKRHSLVQKINTVQLLESPAHRFADEMYGDVLPEIIADVQKGTENIVYEEDYKKALDINFEALMEKEDFKYDNELVKRNKYFELKYKNSKLDSAIANVIEGAKEVSKELGKFIKSGSVIDPAEKDMLLLFKKTIDGIISGKLNAAQIDKIPQLSHCFTALTLHYKLDQVTLDYDTNPKTNKREFKYTLKKQKHEWKDVAIAISDNGVLGTLTSSVKIGEAYDSYYTNGDSSRSDLLSAYEQHVKEADKAFNMTEEEYKQRERYYDTGYTDFAGPRAQKYVLDDSKARVALLKAGYLVSDLPLMSKFYMTVAEVKNRLDQKEDAKLRAVYDKMSATWQEVINHKYMDVDTRTKMYTAMIRTVVDVSPDIKEAKIGVDWGKYKKQLVTKRNADLTIGETATLSADPKRLYEMIDDVDTFWISSSDQYKAMKTALERFSKVGKEEDPAYYEILKNRAYDATKAYIAYKKKQIRDPKEKHSRSDYEAKRVKAANIVLERLESINTMDKVAALATDKRRVVDVNLDIKQAVKFIEKQRTLLAARKAISKYLKDVRDYLSHTQKDIDANFDGADNDKFEGSKEYRAMTAALRNCINVLEDTSLPTNAVSDALRDLRTKSRTYHEKKEGLIFNPLSGSGDIRFKNSLDMVDQIPFYIDLYNNARRQFVGFRDADGDTFVFKTYKEIEGLANQILESNEADIKKNVDEVLDKNKDKQVLDRADNKKLIDMRRKDNKFKNMREGEELLENMKEVTKLQRPLVIKLYEYNEFMHAHYSSMSEPDYYVALKKNMSVSELAKNYVTKKYLDIAYDPDITARELRDIDAMIKDGSIKKESNALASNVVFKAVAKKFPNKVFSKWDEIEKKATKIQEMCGDNSIKITRKNKSIEDYIAEPVLKAESTKRAAYVVVNNIMSDPNSKNARLIAQSLAADESVKPEDEINKLVEITAKKLDSIWKSNPKKDIADIMKDKTVIKDIDKRILDNFNTSAKERKNAVNKAANVNKNTEVNVDNGGKGMSIN